MADSGVICTNWTDATLKLLHILHKRVKGEPELSRDKGISLLNDAEWKELQGLQKELKARSEAM